VKSIRIFLTISIISIIVLANFLAALHGYQESMQEAEILFDHKLESFSKLLAVSSTTNLSNDLERTEGEQSELSSVIYQVRKTDREIIFQSTLFQEPLEFELEINNGYLNYANFRWRYLTRYYPKMERWVLVMEKQDVRYKLAESVILKSVYPIILAVPTIALIIFFIVRRGLRPVGELADSVDAKKASDLSAIHLENVPDELAGLTQRINDLLSRLDNSLSREKRFSSDAAHELRTPIAALNIQMKNLIDEGVDNKENVQALSLGVKRMSHLVEQILMLNRSSPDIYIEQFRKVELTSLLRNLIAELYPLIEESAHNIEFEAKGLASSGSVIILGEEFGLQTLFKNLIINAIKYTPNHGQIRIVLEQSADFVEVNVMDSGSGIDESECKRIFERFYRLDGDRNQSKIIGCGLGLAIVKQVADLHAANIKLSNSQFVQSSGETITSGLCMSLKFKREPFSDKESHS